VQFMFPTHFGAFGSKVFLALKIMNFENVSWTKVFSFLDDKTWMHNIYDIVSNVAKKYFYLTHSCKLGMKNAVFKIINQHRNATCPM
jgi:hypothetical protein